MSSLQNFFSLGCFILKNLLCVRRHWFTIHSLIHLEVFWFSYSEVFDICEDKFNGFKYIFCQAFSITSKLFELERMLWNIADNGEIKV